VLVAGYQDLAIQSPLFLIFIDYSVFVGIDYQEEIFPSFYSHRYMVLCKSNANKIHRNSSFVLATFLRKVIKFSKDVSRVAKQLSEQRFSFVRWVYE